MASDLIDRGELLPNGFIVVNGSKPILTLNDLINKICNAPTVDAVEVVRCAECVNRGDLEKCPMCYQYLPEWFPRDNTDDDGFCHRGVKKDAVD